MSRGKMHETPSDRLKFLMNLLKINIKEFSVKTGIPYRTIQSYLLKERQPNYENLQKIATHLCVNLNWLLTGEGEPFIKSKPVLPEEAMPTRKIPVLGKIPAGFPHYVAEQIIEYIALPEVPENAFAIIAKGDSMSPVIKDGDYVIFLAMPIDIFSGDIVIVNNEWGETMIKRYRIKDNKPILVSENPEYPTIQPNKHYQILGKVISIWRKIKI